MGKKSGDEPIVAREVGNSDSLSQLRGAEDDAFGGLRERDRPKFFL
ncbi:MAG: hypothetical protein ACRD2S_00515 [Terriglobales bacterium]